MDRASELSHGIDIVIEAWCDYRGTLDYRRIFRRILNRIMLYRPSYVDLDEIRPSLDELEVELVIFYSTYTIYFLSTRATV